MKDRDYVSSRLARLLVFLVVTLFVSAVWMDGEVAVAGSTGSAQGPR